MQQPSKIALKGKIIDASGKHIYPGFIGANTNLGLVEVDAVNASNDQTRNGEYDSSRTQFSRLQCRI